MKQKRSNEIKRTRKKAKGKVNRRQENESEKQQRTTYIHLEKKSNSF